MRTGAQTPEELEVLLEDTFLLKDVDSVAQLFEEGAVLGEKDGHLDARGAEQIAMLIESIWAREGTYLAEPPRVLQTRDLALVVTSKGVNVVRRGADGSWRYAISLVDMVEERERKEA